MQNSTVPGPAEPRPADARRLVARAVRLSSMRAKYAGWLAASSPKWTDLPILSKDELNRALEEVLAVGPRERGGSFLYASGGTMGEPRLSLIPGDMFVPDILEHWRPLDPEDVLVNLFTPGRMWSAHYFYNGIAAASGAVAIPFGAVGDDELGSWLDFFQAQGATAMAATPTTVKRLLTYAEQTGTALPWLRKLLWVGEKYDDLTATLVARHLPDVELWGLYGSTETWVVGWNGPRCRTDTVHPLPYQHIELQDGVVLVSNTHPRCVNPLLRYRVGDLGEFTRCPCGRPDAALRVAGRADSYFKFLNQLVSPEELVGLAREVDGVLDAQLGLVAPGTAAERLEVRVLAGPAAGPELLGRVRDRVLAGHLELGYVVSDTPDAFGVRTVPELASNARTAKTPLLVVDPVQ
ncbi:MAG: AMP-binding protein [Catenulispora sp.]